MPASDRTVMSCSSATNSATPCAACGEADVCVDARTARSSPRKAPIRESFKRVIAVTSRLRQAMNLFDDEMRRNPYPIYDRLRATSPVFHFAPADLYFLLDHASVKRALHDTEAFSSAVGGTRGLAFEWLMFMDPPRHTKLRAIINRAFTSRSIAALEPRIRELAKPLVDDVLARGVVDFEAA